MAHSDIDVRQSQRVRIMTERGRSYEEERCAERRKRTVKVLVKRINELDYLMQSENCELVEFQAQYSDFLGVYEDFTIEHQRYQNLLTGPERSEDDKLNFTEVNDSFKDCKIRCENFILNKQIVKKDMQEDIQPADSASQVRSHSGSSSSGRSYISKAKAMDIRRRAELEVRAKALEKRRSLEQEMLHLKLEKDEFELKTEMETIDAQDRALQNFEMQGSAIDRNNESSQFKSVPIDSISVKPVNSDSMKSEILALTHELRKPIPEIKPFNGNVLEFTSFMRQFNARVNATTSSFDEKLNYLLQFTTGEAHKIVQGYSYLRADVGFNAAIGEFQERYGNADAIAHAYVKKALDWKPVKADDVKGLDEFGIFLRECQFAVENVESAQILEYSENMKLLLKKLPYYLHDKWRNIVFEIREKGNIVKFSKFVEFVRREARKANDPTFGRDQVSTNKSDQSSHKKSGKGLSHSKTLIAQVSDQANASNLPLSNVDTKHESNSIKGVAFINLCLFCNNVTHSLDNCSVLRERTLKERYEFLKSKGLCFGCLKSGHFKGSCKKKLVCTICNKLHPFILHVDQKPNSETNSTTFCSDTGARKQTLPIVPVRVKHSDSHKYIDTYAFLDTGSTATFCTESLMNHLGIEGQRKTVTLHTMGEDKTDKCFMLKGLELCSLSNSTVINLPTVISQKELPVSSSDVVNASDLKDWPYLRDVPLLRINSNVDLLIGVNVPAAMEPWQVIQSQNNGPFAIKTVLGWVINGPTELYECSSQQTSAHASVNRVAVTLKPSLEEQLLHHFNQDFCEKAVNDTAESSKEERKFLDLVENSVSKKDGHYVIDLPFREQNTTMPNNKDQAFHRLWLLKKRFNRDNSFYREYTEFMQRIIDKGYAQKVPPDSLDQDDGKVWFLPHHGVYHPQKQKLRVVFDCAARYQGTSLNDKLLQGPSLTNTLVGTLLRFREEEVAFMGDIESMFYQVRVPQSHASFLRFLWWPDGDLSKPATQYQMTVHLFGATSSPSVCNFALRQTALNGHFDKEVVSTVLKNFYVDDCLKSVGSSAKARSMINDLKSVLSAGGFHITKWVSNSKDVMLSIPKEELASELRNLDLERDTLPIERALGVFWNAETDTFEFKLDLKEKPFTRRGVLSVVSSIYDPIGLLSPVILPAKCLIQECCRLRLDWDDELPDDLKISWRKWLGEIGLIKDFRVQRCLKPSGFGEVKEAILHHFSDASIYGYGVVSYLYLQNVKGDIHVSLVTSKSRVAPLKQITVPRLELTAATVAVRLDRMIKSEIGIPIDKSYFWTDSMSVLYYIRNNTARFQTFVANRLTVIQEGSDQTQWMYIPSKSNPADLASRGCTVRQFLENREWACGPAFLNAKSVQWPDQPPSLNVQENDLEIKRSKQCQGLVVSSANIVQQDSGFENPVTKLARHFSKWTSLKRAVVYLLRLRKLLYDKSTQKGSVTRSRSKSVKENQLISLEEIDEAEKTIVRNCQANYFSEDIACLKSGNPVKDRSKIKNLNPYLEDGLLRVGGRLSRSCMPEKSKHPFLLPKNCRVSDLIIGDIHERVGHLGRNSVLAQLRETFWVINAQSAVRKLLSMCVICRKIRAQPGKQQMADLPDDRLVPNEPPFTRVGMDYFGPIEVKLKRSIVKRYGVVFTCFNTRAIHLEVADSLDTSSCINAIRRFVARRGQCTKILSDNGTNSVGARRELLQSIKEWNEGQIHGYLLQRNIDWRFNPPSGSHFGGVWERMIRTTRQVLYAILQQQTLNDDTLNTVLCEVEAIVNDRPITNLPDSHGDLEALTPNHLLLLKRNPSLPPGCFNVNDKYSTRRWRQVQYMTNLFWKRWIREYLPLLQERQKWLRPKRNFSEGDVVLIIDEHAPRGSWPLGRITKTIPDRHGKVRRVFVKTQTNVLERPVHKLCLLVEHEN